VEGFFFMEFVSCRRGLLTIPLGKVFTCRIKIVSKEIIVKGTHQSQGKFSKGIISFDIHKACGISKYFIQI